MSLEEISMQLKEQHNSLTAMELWNPSECGEIDISIKANGDWFYNGTIIKRLPLVKLFASVLIKEVNNKQVEYFLMTPVEKLKIAVEDAPFLITQWCWLDESQSTIKVFTNLGDEFILNDAHPLTINDTGALYIIVRRNLLAKINRNVYYQWVDLAREKLTEHSTELIISSGNCDFSLGSF